MKKPKYTDIRHETKGENFDFNISFFGKIKKDSLTCEIDVCPTLYNFETENGYKGYFRLRRGCYSVNIEIPKWCRSDYNLEFEVCYVYGDTGRNCGDGYPECCFMSEKNIIEIMKRNGLI